MLSKQDEPEEMSEQEWRAQMLKMAELIAEALTDIAHDLQSMTRKEKSGAGYLRVLDVGRPDSI